MQTKYKSVHKLSISTPASTSTYKHIKLVDTYAPKYNDTQMYLLMQQIRSVQDDQNKRETHHRRE